MGIFLDLIAFYPESLLLLLGKFSPQLLSLAIIFAVFCYIILATKLLSIKTHAYLPLLKRIDEPFKYCMVCGKTHLAHPLINIDFSEMDLSGQYSCPRHKENLRSINSWLDYLNAGLKLALICWLVFDLSRSFPWWIVIPLVPAGYTGICSLYVAVFVFYLVRLVNKGEYDKAIIFLHYQFTRFYRNKKVRNLLVFCMANCYFRKGSFNLALNYLDEVDAEITSYILNPYYFNLYAASLLMAGQDLAEAKDLLAQASFLAPSGEYLLWQGYLQLINGNINGGKAYLDLYIRQKQNHNFKWSLPGWLTKQPKFDELILNFILASYHLMMNNQAEAKNYLQILASSTEKNYFCNKAREFLIQV